MYSFLVKGWQSGNDAFRYLLLLSHTGILAAVGLASGHWLKEGKGARLLLTLALASVPANFAILGAFVFSQTAALNADHYPHYVAWSVESLNSLLLTGGAALLILVPVTLLGFTVLARTMSKRLSLLFLATNLALLIPLRDAHSVGLLVIGVLGVITFFSRTTAHGNSSAKTEEGVTALALQLLPLVVLMGRSLWLYAMDLFLMTLLSVTVFALLRQVSLTLEPKSTLRRLLDGIALLPAVATTLWLSAALLDAAPLAEALALPLAALGGAAMVYDIARRSHCNAPFYRQTAVAGLTACLLLNLIFFGSPLAALACATVGLGLIIHGFRLQQRSLFGAGIVLTMAGMSHQLYELVRHFDFGGWGTLTALGIVAIMTASVMESQGGRFKPRLERWKAGFKQWDR